MQISNIKYQISNSFSDWLHQNKFSTFHFPISKTYHLSLITNHSKKGFTLVELLMVVTLMAIISTVVYVNLRSFRDDQTITKSISDIQSLIRVAQTNATSRTLCNTLEGANWLIEFRNTTSIDLKCQVSTNPAVLIKTLTLTNINIQTITGTCNPTFPTNSLILTFAPLSGSLSFSDAGAACVATNPDLNFTIRNTQTLATKQFKINKGGSLDAQ